MGISRQCVNEHKCLIQLIYDRILQENTLVNILGKALLCDFGLARVLEEIPSGLTTTETHTGTTRYASPELISEDVPCHTLKSDVWAWGCLFLVVRVQPCYTFPFFIFNRRWSRTSDLIKL